MRSRSSGSPAGDGSPQTAGGSATSEIPRVAALVETLRSVVDNTRNYDFSVWQWGDAIAIDGLLDASDLMGDPSIVDHVMSYYARWADRPPTWGDHLTPGSALVRLAEAGRLSVDSGLRLAGTLGEAPHTRDGLPLYRPDLGHVRNSCWVDTIYHEPSFFCRLARATGRPEFFDEAVRVWTTHTAALSADRRPFLAHSHDVAAEVTRGYGWGRGNAWALLGMVDALELLPADHPRRTRLVSEFGALAAAVLHAQDASGYWHTLLHDREAYLESSTAAMFGAAFVKGIRVGLLSTAFLRAADRAFAATVARIDERGAHFGVSTWTYAATTRDDDLRLYKALPTETNWWGQGAALRAIVEYVRLIEAHQ